MALGFFGNLWSFIIKWGHMNKLYFLGGVRGGVEGRRVVRSEGGRNRRVVVKRGGGRNGW